MSRDSVILDRLTKTISRLHDIDLLWQYLAFFSQVDYFSSVIKSLFVGAVLIVMALAVAELATRQINLSAVSYPEGKLASA